MVGAAICRAILRPVTAKPEIGLPWLAIRETTLSAIRAGRPDQGDHSIKRTQHRRIGAMAILIRMDTRNRDVHDNLRNSLANVAAASVRSAL